MNATRREFLKGSGATVALGVAGCMTAKGGIERTIAETGFIDIHAHCAEFEMPPAVAPNAKPLCTADELLAHYDEIGVERGVVLALGNPESHVGGMSTEQILRTCAAAPDRLIPSVSLDPRALGNGAFGNFGDVLGYYRDKGCRICGEVCANLHFLDPIMQNYFRGCEEAGLPLAFHVAAGEGYRHGLVDEPGLPELETCLRRFPKLRFFGHSSAFWAEIGRNPTWDERTGCPEGTVEEGRLVELLRKYPNLYGDLSARSGNNALARDLDFAGRFLTEFQDRLMFGLGIREPKGEISPLGNTMKELLRSGRIAPSVYRKVVRENQLRELGLS